LLEIGEETGNDVLNGLADDGGEKLSDTTNSPAASVTKMFFGRGIVEEGHNSLENRFDGPNGTLCEVSLEDRTKGENGTFDEVLVGTGKLFHRKRLDKWHDGVSNCL